MMPAEPAPPIVTPPRPEPPPPPRPARAAPRQAPPVRPIPELPPVALTLPPESGLELVETKLKAAPEPEPELPAGPRRVRPPKVVVAEEPLQIVETRKDVQPPAG